MKLIDIDLYNLIMGEYRMKYRVENKDNDFMKYFEYEFEVSCAIRDAVRAASPPEYRIIQAEYEGWILCDKKLPETGADVILTYKDTFHTHPDWPKIAVKSAWICNVDENKPKGEWAIEGRLGNYIIPIEDGIAWMPLPEPYNLNEKGDK